MPCIHTRFERAIARSARGSPITASSQSITAARSPSFHRTLPVQKSPWSRPVDARRARWPVEIRRQIEKGGCRSVGHGLARQEGERFAGRDCVQIRKETGHCQGVPLGRMPEGLTVTVFQKQPGRRAGRIVIQRPWHRHSTGRQVHQEVKLRVGGIGIGAQVCLPAPAQHDAGRTAVRVDDLEQRHGGGTAALERAAMSQSCPGIVPAENLVDGSNVCVDEESEGTTRQRRRLPRAGDPPAPSSRRRTSSSPRCRWTGD